MNRLNNNKEEARIATKFLLMDSKDRYKPNLKLIEKQAQRQMFSFIYKKKQCEKVAVYKNDENEVPTRDLVISLLENDVLVCLPAVIKPSNQMKFYEIKEIQEYDSYEVLSSNQQLIKSDREIRTLDIDFFLVPMLGMSVNYHRLGRGKGHYDKTIGRIDNNKFGAMLYTRFQIVEFLPDKHDIVIRNVLFLDTI